MKLGNSHVDSTYQVKRHYELVSYVSSKPTGHKLEDSFGQVFAFNFLDLAFDDFGHTTS